MNWKEFGIKVSKGAVSGVAAIAGGLFAAGMPMDQHSLKMVVGSVVSAAIHGVWNVVAQWAENRAG